MAYDPIAHEIVVSACLERDAWDDIGRRLGWAEEADDYAYADGVYARLTAARSTFNDSDNQREEGK